MKDLKDLKKDTVLLLQIINRYRVAVIKTKLGIIACVLGLIFSWWWVFPQAATVFTWIASGLLVWSIWDVWKARKIRKGLTY